ncbi:MAG: MGMT family protein [Syntrophomonadaceae bacterium]|nr:MGMT family protein [Syntrophomonadaceae bacterium]MDD4561758.1 MGMT family protein [Syntrophomonadaceae bacterium]
MSWYIFNTPWGWAAVLGKNRTVQRSVLPTLSLMNIRQVIQQTGLDAQFVVLPDYSFPVVNKFCAYYEGAIITDWDIELSLDALPPFSRKVLEFVYTIPYGETLTYGEVARAMGKPKAARAVGQALKLNPLPLIIPCHRVVASKGPGGFTSPGGIATKLEMLQWERKNLYTNS